MGHGWQFLSAMVSLPVKLSGELLFLLHLRWYFLIQPGGWRSQIHKRLAIVGQNLAEIWPELIGKAKPKPKPGPILECFGRGGGGREAKRVPRGC